MPVSDRTTEERTRADRELRKLMRNPVTLTRPVYFVPGWRDEQGECWKAMATWLPHVITNHRTHVFFVTFNDAQGGFVPPWEDFLDFADDLADLIHRFTTAGEQVDIVCHSMGGLDTAAAIALLDGHPTLEGPPLRHAHTVITYDTPFQGFGAADNDIFKAFVSAGRDDPWVLLQLGAMHTNSKRIEEVWESRDEFLAHVSAFWPRGADNFDGILEVPHESASFGRKSDFSASVRERYRGYFSWPDTSHSGRNGVTHDKRVILEVVQILTGVKA